MFENGVGIRNPLFFVGVVEEAIDRRHENRVKVRAFGVHGTVDEIPSDDLPWAIVVAGNYNFNALPLLNEWVFGVFLDGRDAQQPLVLGSIPTLRLDAINPEVNGWGVIPQDRDGGRLDGRPPESIGTPSGHPDFTGEYNEERFIEAATRAATVNIVPPSTGLPDETEENVTPITAPGPAGMPMYPHNRVYTSPDGNTLLELDSTPGAERLQLSHRGSSITMDSNGTRVDYSASDNWEINSKSKTVYIGGASQVHIVGNCSVKIEGDKVEEISGNLIQNVHGNYYLGVGGQVSINGGDEVQMRSAQVRLESNVAGLNIKSAKALNLESLQSVNVKATDNIYLQCDTDLNVIAKTINVGSSGDVQISSGGAIKIGSDGDTNIASGSDVKIGGSITHIDTDIRTKTIDASQLNSGIVKTNTMNSGIATSISGSINATFTNVTPTAASEPTSPSGEVGAASPASGTEMPEPPARIESINATISNARVSTVGMASRDDLPEGGGSSGSGQDFAAGGNFTQSTSLLAPILDLIAEAEGTDRLLGYDTWYSGISSFDLPTTPLTQLTIGEVLEAQERIDSRYISEAAGRYQIIEDTLRGYNNDTSSGPGNPLYTRAGLSTSSLFNPVNQDKLATVLMEYDGLNEWLEGSISDTTFLNRLAGTWAGLPQVSGPNAGLSVYEGDSAGNSAYSEATFITRLYQALEQVRQNYNSFNILPPR